ncbi:MAG: phosphatase PAP2 family protein, partial [Actinomycetota bacterium]|nr:phosphatase PAP2 family protein [Actinomycetota bacterium]
SFIVGRDRPPVEQLDAAAPSGSFPSGHSAAAVAFYSSLLVIVRWHTKRRALRSTLFTVAVIVPIVVAFSRVARGMHHPIDVVAGLLLGVMSILVVRAAMKAGVDEIDRNAVAGDHPHDAGHDATAPHRVRRLDLTHTARAGSW